MAFELKPGTGNLFKNDKDGNEARPDYKGELKLENGETIRLAAWIKEGQKGKFMSIRVDKPREQSFSGGRDEGVARGGGGGGGSQSERSGHRQAFDLDDDLPFARPAFDWEA